MNIIVTGAAGFIGSHLTEALLEAGHHVIGIDNFLTGDKKNLEPFSHESRFTFKEQDITFPFFTEESIHQIYHLACPASPLDYQNFPLETLWTSACGTRNVLELARKHDAKFLFTSTSEVYGDPLVHPQTENYFGNVHCIGPRSCYDEGKRFAESFIVNYSKIHGVSYKIVRIFNTYGPRMRLYDGRVIPNFISNALYGKPLWIYGRGEQTRSFCYISDMVEGLLSMMETSDFSGPVNLGNQEEISMITLAKNIIELSNSSSSIDFRDPLPEDPQKRCPDITLAQNRLAFQPKIPLKVGLQKTIEWFKNELNTFLL